MGGGSGGAEGQELAGGGVCLRFLLGILEIAVVQEHLFSRLEGWHPKVGAVGASESIPQVALWRERESPREAKGLRTS